MTNIGSIITDDIYTKDGTNIRFVFQILNIQTFSCYSIQNLKHLQKYQQISLKYFPSCPRRKIGHRQTLNF